MNRLATSRLGIDSFRSAFSAREPPFYVAVALVGADVTTLTTVLTVVVDVVVAAAVVDVVPPALQ